MFWFKLIYPQLLIRCIITTIILISIPAQPKVIHIKDEEKFVCPHFDPSKMKWTELDAKLIAADLHHHEDLTKSLLIDKSMTA